MKIFYTWSEAIRAGIAIRPVQAFNKFYDPETDGTCANGAALEAIFGETFDNEKIRARWSEVGNVIREYYSLCLNHRVLLPCDCAELFDGPRGMEDEPEGRLHRLDNIVVHLNNHHRWTREQIADWLEGEEEKLGYVTIAEADTVVV